MLKEIATLLGKSLASNLAESFMDNVLKKRVTPAVGSVVYCELVFDMASHSGVYVGDNRIVHLDGSGKIEIVSAKEFLKRLDGFNSAISIYVSCKDSVPVGSEEIAKRALDMAGNSLDYNLVFNNCHKFTSGCVTGDFDNSDIILEKLKSKVNLKIGADNWLVWETQDGEYIS